MNAITGLRQPWMPMPPAPRGAAHISTSPQTAADTVELGHTPTAAPAPPAAQTTAPAAVTASSDSEFEKRAETFARFTRNQAAAGFDVTLRLSESQVRRLSDAQKAILSKHQIKIDVAETPLARVRPGASRLEQQLVQEENDRAGLVPDLYFVNNYVVTPRTVLHMEG